MEFDDLQALLWVHVHGSLHAAARAEGVSRSTLRRRLERLEASLGIPACVVRGDGVELTSAGEALARKGPDLLRRRAELLDEARGGAPIESVRFLVGAGLPPMLVALALRTLREALPELRFEVTVTPDPLARLEEGFDLALHWGDAPSGVEGFTRVLGRFAFAVHGAAAYLAERGVPRRPEDLADHDLLDTVGGPGAWPLADGGVVRIAPRLLAPDLYTLGCFAAAGLGLALIPRGGLGVHPAVEALVPVLEDSVASVGVLRVFAPVPTRPESVAAQVIARIEQIAAGIG